MFLSPGLYFRDDIEELEDPPQATYNPDYFDADAFLATQPPYDMMQPSQLQDAPLPTQDPMSTPQAPPRPTRQVQPPEQLSYPTDHVHAQRVRRPRRGGRPPAPKRGRQ